MKPQFAFKFANSSTAISDIRNVRFRDQQARRGTGYGLRQGKPIHAYFTYGMQVVGVPHELLRKIGPAHIASVNAGINFEDVSKTASGTTARDSSRLITSVHMETPEAIYLLRIDNQIYMAMPD